MDIDSLVVNEQEMAVSEKRLTMKPEGAYPQKGDGGVPYPPQSGGSPGLTNTLVKAPEAPGHDGEPTDPSTDSMDQLPGYHNIGFEGAALPPPSYTEAVSGPPSRDAVRSASAITDQEARDAIIQHVSEHCCYGKSPAAEMQFTGMTSTSAFHYTLETFGESRSTRWASQPYRGEAIVVTGPPPGPWDLQVQAPQMFATASLDVEVPNTSSVKPCFRCHGRGYKTCSSCLGRGRVTCTSCNGYGRASYFDNGQEYFRDCTWCSGGYRDCYSCNGSGQVMCNRCQGRGSLRWFILLTIQWTNHLEDHIVERTALPDELIRTVRGQTAFEETSQRVWPVNHFPEQEINAASQNLINKHASQFSTERILMQHHIIRIVPVTEVAYTYKENNATFFVYGDEHKVYAPDYPAKCCWGCIVL